MPDADEPRWLSPSEQEAWLAVLTLLLQLPGPLESQLQCDSGLTLFEYLVLSSLSMAPDRSLRMTELARLSNASASRLSNVVARFERRGVVQRSADPSDARGLIATLTDAGRDEVVAAAPGHVAAVRRYVVDPLTTTQLRAIVEAVDRMRPLLGERRG